MDIKKSSIHVNGQATSYTNISGGSFPSLNYFANFQTTPTTQNLVSTL